MKTRRLLALLLVLAISMSLVLTSCFSTPENPDNGGEQGGNTGGGGNGGGDVGSGDYVYFTDNAGWGTVYCHTWNTVGGTTQWPGVQMENTGGNQYRVMVDSSHTMVKFNNGNGVEGSEAELVIGNTYSN